MIKCKKQTAMEKVGGKEIGFINRICGKDYYGVSDPLRNKPILTPATSKLFEVRPEVPKLCPDKKQKFHRIVAQLLYIMKRARPDLAPAVPFLTTRVCDPTDDDWLKLRHMIEYLAATKYLCLTLVVDKSKNPVFSIDAAHQAHDKFKGLWVKVLSFLCHVSRKFNTRSSTEAELVAVYDCLSHLLWLRKA